jgi:tetratricopeptide (TPR) repeat protein
MEQVVKDDPPPPRQLERAVPRALERICLKCLRKNRDQRYATAESLAYDLRRYLRGEPILARPVGLLERGWLRRRRTPIVLSLVLLTAAILGAGSISYFSGSKLIVPMSHDQALAQWTKAHEMVKQEKWDEAARLMQATIPHLSHDLRKWQELHHVWLYLGEFDQVQAICDEMLRRFGDTADPDTAHIIAQACLALPDRKLGPQVQRLAELSATDRNPVNHRDMGMLYYRQDELPEAERWLTKALKSRESYRPATFYYLAMVRHKIGDEVGAQEAFCEADRTSKLRNSEISAGGHDPLRFGSLVIEAVRREAEEVLSSQ